MAAIVEETYQNEATTDSSKRGNYVESEENEEPKEGVCFMSDSNDNQNVDNENSIFFCIDSGCTDH